MRIVCWQTILMKYHSLFLSKIRKDVENLSSAAVVIGPLKVNAYPIKIPSDLLCTSAAYIKGLDIKKNERKIVNIFLPISL